MRAFANIVLKSLVLSSLFFFFLSSSFLLLLLFLILLPSSNASCVKDRLTMNLTLYRRTIHSVTLFLGNPPGRLNWLYCQLSVTAEDILKATISQLASVRHYCRRVSAQSFSSGEIAHSRRPKPNTKRSPIHVLTTLDHALPQLSKSSTLAVWPLSPLRHLLSSRAVSGFSETDDAVKTRKTRQHRLLNRMYV